MTVKELRQRLSRCPEDATVVVQLNRPVAAADDVIVLDASELGVGATMVCIRSAESKDSYSDG